VILARRIEATAQFKDKFNCVRLKGTRPLQEQRQQQQRSNIRTKCDGCPVPLCGTGRYNGNDDGNNNGKDSGGTFGS